MLHRIYVEKRPGQAHQAQALLLELREYAGISHLQGLRLIHRYDVEGLSPQLFEQAVHSVFSEPQLDSVSQQLELLADETALALEYLPGQFDQRADSAAQCIQMLSQGERPLVRTARIFVLQGKISENDLVAAKKHLLNPVESREASFEMPASLQQHFPQPGQPLVLSGFRGLDAAGLQAMIDHEGLAMDLADLQVFQDYFIREGRDPSQTELMVVDTYWSDHCRHTTFLTEITGVTCDDPVINQTLADYQAARKALGREHKPMTLMDVGTLAARQLAAQGLLPEYEQTEENNACTLKVQVQTDKGPEDWLLFFKNETHNHPTEIEPFGGAATCIGGAIRDPLSARAYVYAGMRVSGSADPTQPLANTLPGKLPQRLITQGAAAGFSSYGNQIGVPTGCVREIYHEGYAAKRLEAGAVLAAAPARHVRRERPAPGDVVLLVGGRTGRDGCGGATGSSQAHTKDSVEVCAAQVQKGNAPEERKLQRLFLNPEATRLIKRCNDFGAGGVSVAIGELAAGLTINLDAVPVKYQGLSATELAISESQERMAVVVEAQDAQRFIQLAEEENLEATVVAEVTAEESLVMHFRGQPVVRLSRAFLDENGARKRMAVAMDAPSYNPAKRVAGFAEGLMALASDLNACSKRGLIENFDSTVGAASVLLPLGGKHQATPPAAMVHRLPVPGGSSTCSFMACGYNPQILKASPYHGAYLAVVESAARLVAAGASRDAVYLSFQEYFPRPGSDPKRWGLPLAAVLGAYRAQVQLKMAAIGGKDSMSGSFEKLDVPPTLISFAVTTGSDSQVVSPEFKQPGNRVVWLKPQMGADKLPTANSLLAIWDEARQLMAQGQVLACAAPAYGGAALALMEMAQGNGIGLSIADTVSLNDLFEDAYGSLILEVQAGCTAGSLLGQTSASPALTHQGQAVKLSDFNQTSNKRLEGVFPVQVPGYAKETVPVVTSRKPAAKGPSLAKPRVLIPAFPGTNCEEDTARAFRLAGALPQVFVVRNRTASEVAQSVQAFADSLAQSQILLIPGGFSGGDEPEGSGKFIAAFLRAQPVQDALMALLDTRQGLVGGICNGFQALIKVGLLPGGRIQATDANSPTLTRNRILRHQSRLVSVRVASSLSPWFSKYEVGQVYTLPISHGEGRFLCQPEQFETLAAAGQVAAQYCNASGQPSMDIDVNPPGAAFAVEALTSPDGRVMGRMGHAERMLKGLYKNVPTSGHDPLFEAAVGYYK